MKTDWDYTNMAEAYLKRPDYSSAALEKMLSVAKIAGGGVQYRICDIGAGAAHLTLFLAKKNFDVVAIEPNDAMRANGIKRTAKYKNVKWLEGVGEHTNQPSDFFDMVTFGSSFGVTNRDEALAESQRILKKDGWFACMWNHRDLSDPIQMKIENIIKSHVKDYKYGTRRESQNQIIADSGRFDNVLDFTERVVYEIPVEDIVEGWRSHGTLERQSGENFTTIVEDIARFLRSLGKDKISVPYDTHVYMARVIK